MNGDLNLEYESSAIDRGQDPYATCEERCTHDTVRGCFTLEIVGPHDGPHPDPTTDRMFAIWRNRTRPRTENE